MALPHGITIKTVMGEQFKAWKFEEWTESDCKYTFNYFNDIQLYF